MTEVRRDRVWRLAGLTAVLLGHGGLVWALLPGTEGRPAAPVAAASVLAVVLIDPVAPASPVVTRAAEPERPKPVTLRPAAKAIPAAKAPPSPALPSAQAEETSAVASAPSSPSAAAVAASAPAPSEPVRQPALISCQAPSYPPQSRRAGETGTVQLQLLIDGAGAVVDQRVEHSSGFPRLDEAALIALAKCRFQPGTADGRRETSWARLRYVWKLE